MSGGGCGLTPLAPPLLGAVDVVLQLDADLPLVWQVPDERVLEELLRAGSLAVALHQAALNERLELLRPENQHQRVHFKKAAVILRCDRPASDADAHSPLLRLESGGGVARDEEEGSHWVHVAQR